MTEHGSVFDEAWARWRRALTEALQPASGEVSAQTHAALEAAGAFNPTDGFIDRDWALGLLTNEAARTRPLRAQGLSKHDLHRLSALLQRHPLPAAGG